MKVNPILALAADLRFGDFDTDPPTRLGDPVTGKEMKVTYAKFDGYEILELPILGMIDLARRTVCLAMAECRRPDPSTASDVVEDTLAQAMMLTSMLRVMEDHVYDWNVTEHTTTLRQLQYMFQEAMRHSHVRFDRNHRARRDDLLANVARRFQDDLQQVRVLESRLREHLKNPYHVEFDYDALRPEVFVASCFSAALELESNFDDRMFGSR